MSEPARLYTMAEVADKLAVSRNLAYQLVASGSLPSVRLAGSRVIRVRPEALDTWVRAQETRA